MNAGLLLPLFILAILLIVYGPLISIWALNTLFGLAIPYTLKTWFASLWIAGIVGGTKVATSR